MGHEATGVVEAVGDGVARVQPGQAVLLNPIIACGACDSCARGRGNLCRNAGLFGREMDGSLAEHVVLPESYLYPLPAHVPLAAATLIETLATVRHAQERARIAPGESVVVLGQGVAGLLHTQLAKLSGACPVVAVSRSPWKLELARRRHADRVVNSAHEDAIAAVREATAGRGADVVVDAAGDPTLIAPAIEMLAPGGRLLVYGISHRPVPDFTTFPLYFKELTLYGSRALTPGDFAPAIDLVASGAVDVDGFITASYPLERVAAAFAEYERSADSVLRLVIVPRE
jgi:2-desacetyl-2-hydroxyethyl bacteriochlorophyllide A dehydrogenase